MADLTEDQQRAFADRITEMYGDADTKDKLTAKDSGLDPSKRHAVLLAKQDVATKAENVQTKKKAELKDATTASVTATSAYYKEASEGAGALAKELGEEDALSQEIRKMRPGMSNPAARGSGATGGAAKQTP